MFRLLVGLVGVTSVIVAAALLFGGGSLLWVDTTLTDADGYVNTVPMEVEVDGYALVAGPAEINIEPELPIDVGELATIRFRAENQSPSQGIFIGVAESVALDGYLGGATYAVIEDLGEDSFDLSYRTSTTGEIPLSPTAVDIWVTSTHGVGEQVLEWEIVSGDFSFVVMNEAATDELLFEIVVGARVPLVRPISVSLLVGGGLVLSLGTILLALAL